MTDNEKLIEWARSGNHLATRPGLVLELADALEAAEKAHTPTDDEREALLNAEGWPLPAVVDVVMKRWGNDNDTIRRGGGDWSWKGLAETAIQALAQAGLLRRSAVPEPSENARVARGIRAFTKLVRSELDATRDAYINLGDDYLHGVYSALQQADDHAARIENDLSEPQGEPSDAQVEAAADAWMEFHGRHEHILVMMRAALRAARGAR